MVNERPDGLEIFGGYKLKGEITSSFNDHRIAMMAACLRGQTDGDIMIEGAEAVTKSYPEFFDDLRTLKLDRSDVDPAARAVLTSYAEDMSCHRKAEAQDIC